MADEIGISFKKEDWKLIDNGIEKLLDFEAKQRHKVITYKEFGILEHLLIKIRDKDKTKDHRG